MTYWEICFTTIPGITGIILLVDIILLGLTSLEKVRWKYFQLFAFTHFFGVPTFVIGIVIHGSDTWLNYGFPLGLLILPFLGFTIFMYLRWAFDRFFSKFEIVDVSITADCEFARVVVKKPKNYEYKPGQYLFINAPCASYLQWHPYTIASAPKNKYLVLLVKKAGDWSGKLLRRLKTSKRVAVEHQLK